MSIRILLAEDHGLMRQGLQALLRDESELEIVGEAVNGQEAVALARDLQPDVVVMDVIMPEMTGIAAAQQIKESCPDVQIIALSAHADKRFVVEMLKAGASGYLLKRYALEDLRRAIDSVLAGQVYLSPGIMGVVVEDYMQQLTNNEKPERPKLTAREQEVLKLLAEGQSSKQIGATLNVSVQTVSGHRVQLMTKLGLSSIAELTKYAIREGITSIDA